MVSNQAIILHIFFATVSQLIKIIRFTALCWLAGTTEAVQKELSNSDADWRPDGCSEARVTADAADIEDKLDSSMYAASEPAATDGGIGGWAENIAAASGAEAGASGWLDIGLKNIDTNGDEWAGTTASSLLSVDRHSQRFTASVVINTANQERRKFIVDR